MAKAGKAKADGKQVVHYQYAGEKRTNIPTAIIAGQGALPKAEKRPLRCWEIPPATRD